MSKRRHKQQLKGFGPRPKTTAPPQAQQGRQVGRGPAPSGYYMCPFDELFPDQAAQEYATLRVTQEDGTVVDDYTVIEYICSNPACDCHKLLLDVVAHSSHQSMALIDLDLRRFTRAHLSDDKSHSPFAHTRLALLAQHKLSEPAYQTGLKAHYQQFKQAVRNPTADQATVLRRYRDR